MNYRKFIYRRLDYLVDKAVKMLDNGEELVEGFKTAHGLSKKLRAESKKIKDNYQTLGFTWEEAVRKFCAIDREAEDLLKGAVRSYLGPQFVNVHVLVGYCPQTIPYYQKMIKELRKTFPAAKVKDVNLGKVTKSSYVQGFTLITWSGEASFWETGADYPKYALKCEPQSKIWQEWHVAEQCEYY